MKKYVYWFLLSTMGLTTALMVVVIFWLVYPYEVLTFNKQPFVVLNSDVDIDTIDLDSISKQTDRPMAYIQAGQPIPVIWDFCKNAQLKSSNFTVQLENSVIIGLPTTSAELKQGCYKVLVRSFSAPSFMQDGEVAKLVFNVEFRVNPVRTINYRFESENFVIVTN